MDPRLLRITALTGLGVALLVAGLFLFVDQPVDLAVHSLKGGVWYHAGQTISLLADHTWFDIWLVAGLVLGGGLALGRGPTPAVRALLYVCIAVALTILVGETLKWFFGRFRPVMLFEHSLYGFSWFADKGSQHSFPSGHTMRIFSAMTALALVWPRGRWAFGAVALAVGISRVLVTRHYPSDVLAGAFVGIFCALWVWSLMQGWIKGPETTGAEGSGNS